jgi:hypothetical protein
MTVQSPADWIDGFTAGVALMSSVPDAREMYEARVAEYIRAKRRQKEDEGSRRPPPLPSPSR